MSISSLHQYSLFKAQLRTISTNMGFPPGHARPAASVIAALAKHGGMYTLLDSDLMTARVGALTGSTSPSSPASAIAAAAGQAAASYFYRLDNRPGYTIHSELMAYLSEPGNDNGILYNEGEQPSDHVPAAFTFVGQFIDHDLTFNPMDLTVDESGEVVMDEASPFIDLDHVYGPRENVSDDTKQFYASIFDRTGHFKLEQVQGDPSGFDVPRRPDPSKPGQYLAYIFDPRNDENQLILQIHILIERFHNKLRDDPKFAPKLKGAKNAQEIVARVRREVVATWQSFVLNDYMPAVLDNPTLDYVLQQIHIQATDPAHPEAQYGEMKNKPYRDLTNGKNVARMPHEFAIGFRFGHSQLRPAYLLNNNNVVLLFMDARHGDEVTIEGNPVKVSGKDDLRGRRKLEASHVIDWRVFYPQTFSPDTASMLIDDKVTARVFNLPETAIPDDVTYIGNLPHRNLIRSTQIGLVSGEELAEFYGYTSLTPDQVTSNDPRPAAKALFELDSNPDDPVFKTPLWYYLLREAQLQHGGDSLGQLGSRLVAEVLAGAIYWGNDYPYDDNWTSTVFPSNKVTLREIVNYVLS